MEYKAINMSQKDMDYIEQRRLSRDEILAAFKVPKAIL
ncbi:MAG: phage portal protein [Rickettsiales bacterium]|nr:MAG: phage portal protein [Rickettsiales bacterium]